MIDYKAAIDRFGIVPKGVMHVGAFAGQENQSYVDYGFANRLFVEAQPDTFSYLQAQLHGTGSHCENYAASDRNGRAKFYIADNGQSSSLLEMAKHSEIYPSIRHTNTVEVETVRIDDLLSRPKYKDLSFNFLNVDIQGAELMALSGAPLTLRELDLINLEVNFDELYVGAPHIRQLDAFLSAFDFIRVDTYLAHATWGDALYVPNRLTRSSSAVSRKPSQNA